MFTRLFGIMILAASLSFSLIGTVRADDGWHGRGGDPSAPELDPTALGSGVALLAGGIVLLNERRRARR
ncbi:MAG TPA: hypothetical protein VHY56_05035 [Candidatus Binataceae bacterium]|nr:hypothetical protein [Candidatus Binataceae bacterium]